MTDLRKAAEELIKEWDWECGEHQNKALTELIEALRQALAQPEEWKHCRHCGFQYRPPKENKWHPLAQPEEKMRVEGSGKLTTKPYPDGYDSEQEFREAIRKASAQPDGFVYSGDRSYRLSPSTGSFGIGDAPEKKPQQEPIKYKCTIIDDEHPNGIPLEQWGNTAPPKHEWVGLTDAEVEAWRGNYDFFDSALVREVEAKLKEKNS